jgi:pyruvate/2-oxoglutarate dehydrogenase complex dihydrolipoamide dehydrogenase (E3) component
VVLEAAIAAIERRSGNQVGVRLRTPASEREVDGSDLLVAVGRTPNRRGIGLESAGVELDLRGYVKVNERLETTAPGVWAMGECAGSPQFTPVVSGWCATISADDSRSTDPYCMFIDPELGRVGLGEAEAKRRG